MNKCKQALFLAAENGALRGGKVGGVADVVGDLPAALPQHGWSATVITPSYGVLHKLDGAKQLKTLSVPFAKRQEKFTIWEVPGNFNSVRNLVVEHPLFAANGTGQIYFGDEDGRPYATDANKFALFCATVAEWLVTEKHQFDVVHMHDWHAAFFSLLRACSSRYAGLKTIRTVFTIHNLAYQGTRPLRGDKSSLETWFPDLKYDEDTVGDPAYPGCINPMAMAVRLADRISTVSPTYAKEICQPSDKASGFVGGEGLEILLQQAARDKRLVGVLNGCYYDKPRTDMSWHELLRAMRVQVEAWLAAKPKSEIHKLAAKRLAALTNKRPGTVLLSIGRLVAQKATLLQARTSSGKPALEQVARELADDALIIILGSGEAVYEELVADIATRNDNVLFLHGYSETLADPLYELGDLFLMPSSFEPCGISQMLAMRAGLPCVVHGVGGLKDTVRHESTGFVFQGNGLDEQAQSFVDATSSALRLRIEDARAWKKICERAGRVRLEWSDAARETINLLYETHND
jgi:starch synthase